MIHVRPSVSDKRMAHAVAMDAKRQRVGSSIIEALTLPDWEAIARALRDGHREKAHHEIARILAGHGIQERIAAAMLSGTCIAMLARKTERLPIVVASQFRAPQPEAIPKFDTPEAALEYWRARLNLDDAQVAELRAHIREFFALSQQVAGDVSRATLAQVEKFLSTATSENLTGDEFVTRFVQSIEPTANAWIESIIRSELAKSYGIRRLRDARLGSMAGNQTTPFIQFLSVPDDRRTPVCRAMHRYIAASDAALWDELRPPLHWNCRSDISLIAYPEAIRRGIAAYSPDGRGLIYTRGPEPYGPPPVWTTDAKGRAVPVAPQPGFGAGYRRAA